jgi:hypothetical protein
VRDVTVGDSSSESLFVGLAYIENLVKRTEAAVVGMSTLSSLRSGKARADGLAMKTNCFAGLLPG